MVTSTDVKSRRQGRKKAVGVRERGVPSLDDAFREGLHEQYLSQHGHILLGLQERM
jgi:hypothetical protein